MNTDNSIATFWHSYALAEKAPKLLTGKTAQLTSGPMADTVHADEPPDDNNMLEVIEYYHLTRQVVADIHTVGCLSGDERPIGKP